MLPIRTYATWTLLVLMACACKQRQDAGSDVAAVPAGRRLLGMGAAYPADPRQPDAIVAALTPSLLARRAFGWEVVRKLLRPVDLSANAAASAPGTVLPRVPAFMTWYTADEAQAAFKLFYNQLRTQQAAGSCGSAGCDRMQIAQAALATYSTQQDPGTNVMSFYNRLLATVTQGGDPGAASAAGLGKEALGATLVVFSPSTVLHYMVHYDDVGRCLAKYMADNAPPPPVMDPTLTQDVFGACFGDNNPFPADAVTVKTRWVLDSNATIPVTTTDAAGLSASLATPTAAWQTAPQTQVAIPPDGKGYRVRVLTGSKSYDYVLTGMHVTTKEVPNWVWVSLWWNDQPDTDFGSDRPQQLCETSDCSEDELAPFRNYKMCVTTDFAEADPLFKNPVADNDPNAALLKPLKAVYDKTGDSWCSNQYIESGAHEVGTNCIGCHQFAAPGQRFARPWPQGSPFAVADKRANNFLSDFMWSFAEEPDAIGARIDDMRQDLDSQPLPTPAPAPAPAPQP